MVVDVAKSLPKKKDKESSAPTAQRVRKAAKAGDKKKAKEGKFVSVDGSHYDSAKEYGDMKARHPNTKFTLLRAIIEKFTSKGVKNAVIKIASEPTLKARHIGYVAQTLPGAILDVAPNGDKYYVRNKVTKEMPKLDKNGKPNGNTSKNGLIEFELIKI